ncbi:hypothetical protein J6590_074122 [Homalodisca vitripennis]|nr:hypothetical protein J6590_074122 [Homalodisca vitripennis]
MGSERPLLGRGARRRQLLGLLPQTVGKRKRETQCSCQTHTAVTQVRCPVVSATAADWSNGGLKTNSSKSNVLNFSLRSTDCEYGPAIVLDKAILEGLSLEFPWNLPRYVCSKLASGIYVLISLVKYCPIQVMMTAYYGLFSPHLTYGLVLWGTMCK